MSISIGALFTALIGLALLALASYNEYRDSKRLENKIILSEEESNRMETNSTWNFILFFCGIILLLSGAEAL